MKYFISYNKLIKDKSLERKLDITCESLFIKKIQDDDTVKFYSTSHFMDELNNLIKSKSFTDMLMIEVKEEQLDLVEEKDLETYNETKSGTYERTYKKYETEDVTLLNYNCLSGMSLYDLELGYIVSVKKRGNKEFYITDRLHNSRALLQSTEIGSDLYFYTENEDLLDKFKDSSTEFKNNGVNKYTLSKHRIIVIDSISQNRVNDFTFNTFMRFRELCDDSIRISIDRFEDKYKLNILNTISSRDKKGYIISNTNFSNMLYDPSMEPLLNYINIYELDSDDECVYKKIPLTEYLKNHKGVKSYINKNYERVDSRAA